MKWSRVFAHERQLKSNQKMFSMFHKNVESKSILSKARVYFRKQEYIFESKSILSKARVYFESKSIFSIKHPIENDQYCDLFLLYDPLHLLKNMGNKWCTEQCKS